MTARRSQLLAFLRLHWSKVRAGLVLGLLLVFALGDQLTPLRTVVGRLLRPMENTSQREEEEESKEENRLASAAGAARRHALRARLASHASLNSHICPHSAAPFAVAAALSQPAHQALFPSLARNGLGIPLRC